MASSAPDFGDGPAPKRYPNTRPKNAASLIVADISGPNPRFLMGQRSNAHVFMPGFFVFPGGRMERGDTTDQSIHKTDTARLEAQSTRQNLAAALLGCALRETFEETGLDLSAHVGPMRYISRAITPPGQIRRYDTRFFLTLASSASLDQLSPPDNELLTVDWFDAQSIPKARLHRITGLVLGAALARLESDPTLTKDMKTPTHRFRYGKPVVEWE
ncbi:MAG: NUDIX hydrolase [Pseudomonadota bacterium]